MVGQFFSYGWTVRVPGRPYALPKLFGRERGDEAFLWRVRGAATLTVPHLRFRERAHGEVLWRLRKACWGGRCSKSPSHTPFTSHRWRRTPPAHRHVLRSRWLDSAGLAARSRGPA